MINVSDWLKGQFYRRGDESAGSKPVTHQAGGFLDLSSYLRRVDAVGEQVVPETDLAERT